MSKESKTQENLKAAFAGESQARNKYTFFSKVARKQGYHYIAKIFEETAHNEHHHAKEELKLLHQIVQKDVEDRDKCEATFSLIIGKDWEDIEKGLEKASKSSQNET